MEMMLYNNNIDHGVFLPLTPSKGGHRPNIEMFYTHKFVDRFITYVNGFRSKRIPAWKNANLVKLICVIGSILCVFPAFSQTDLDSYMQSYSATGQSNAELEREILSQLSSKKLIANLEPFYTDSLLRVRRKAYYLSYKKAKLEPHKNQTSLIQKLVEGCADENSAIINQSIRYLTQFSIDAFSKKCLSDIEMLLAKEKYQQFEEIYLLAGFLNIGFEPMYKTYIKPETSQKLKWTLGLALSRMGNEQAIADCLSAASELELGDNTVAYLVPDLVYTRQRQAVDYCVDILHNDDKLCSSPNAESSAKIVCGYRVMEILAPVIKDFPFETDASGTLKTNNYEQALKETRLWFDNHPDYELIQNIY